MLPTHLHRPSRRNRRAVLWASLLAAFSFPLDLLADGNPQNPANWTVLANVVQGTDTFSRKEYVLQNGGYVPSATTYTRDWQTMVWHRNGAPLIGFSLPQPFQKMVTESDTIQADSHGTVEIKLQWNQSPDFPPPNKVRVRVASSASALLGKNCLPSVVVENGLNSDLIQEEEASWWCYSKSSPEIRTVKVVYGLGKFTLTKSSFSMRNCGVGVVPEDVVWAEAHDGTMQADGRNVVVLVGGAAQWQRVVTGGQTLHASPITWTKNWHHNVFEPQAPVSFIYPTATKVPVEIQYESPSLNAAFYRLSIPTRGGYAHGSEPPGHLPECLYPLTLVGFAASEQTPTEYFEWTGGPQGSLPDPVYGWTFPSKAIELVKHHLTQFEAGNEKWATWEPTITENTTTSLRYTWSDGVFAESVAGIEFCEPREDVVSTEIVTDESQTDVALEFEEYGFVVPAGTESANGIFTATAFSKSSVITVSGLVSAVLGAGAFWQPWLGIPTSIAAAIGFLVEFVKNESDIREVLRPGDPLFSWWHYGNVTYENPPESWNPDEWQWCVDLRPAIKKQLTAYDRWDTTGYVGRFVDTVSWRQPANNARRLRYYYLVGGSGEEGQGGPGGGS